MFEAQRHGLLGSTSSPSASPRACCRSSACSQRGDSDVSERLAQRPAVLLRAGGAGRPRHRRAAPDGRARGLRLRRAARRSTTRTASSAASTRRCIAQARKRVAAAKEAWSAMAGGEMHRSGRPGRAVRPGRRFAAAPVPARRDVRRRAADGGRADPGRAGRAAARRWRWRSRPACSTSRPRSRTATSTIPSTPSASQRLGRAARPRAPGRPPEPLEAWMEELYRRVSDRQTMGSVVQELRASLAEVEKSIDQFFRNPDDTRRADRRCRRSWRRCAACCRCSAWTQASQALLRMRDEVDGLIVDRGRCRRRSRRPASFERLAGNLGALGFLIDMLSVQPQHGQVAVRLRRRSRRR